MPLPIPFFVYGIVKNNRGRILYGASVSVDTHSTGVNNSGQFQINLQDLCDDEDTVTLIGSYRGKTSSISFQLDLDDISKNIDIIIPVTSFKIVSSDTNKVKINKSNRRFHII